MAGEGVGITQRVLNVTIAKWGKRISNETIQKYLFLKLLKEKGKIKKNCHGGENRWPWQYRRHKLRGHQDAVPKQFARETVTKNANLPWKGYDGSEFISLMEKGQNGGEEAMVKLFSNRMALLEESLTDELGRQFYLDETLTGDPVGTGFAGIESMMSLTGQTATDEFATTLDDTYAGQGTSYTAHGTAGQTPVKGTNPEYGAWSPVIVNCNRTVDAATVAWDEGADEYIRCGIIEASKSSSQSYMPDIGLLTKTAYKELLNILDDKEHLHFSRGGKDPGGAAFGFSAMPSIDGVPFTWDFGIPGTDSRSDVVYGYMLNCDQIELRLLDQANIWRSFVNWNIRQGGDELYMVCLGQLLFECPRYQTKFAAIS